MSARMAALLHAAKNETLHTNPKRDSFFHHAA